MAIHEFPPGDEGETYIGDDGFTPAGKALTPGFLNKLKPKFHESYRVCMYCSDTGFQLCQTTTKIHGPGYKPCSWCRRGERIELGWWAELREFHENRGRHQPSPNERKPPMPPMKESPE